MFEAKLSEGYIFKRIVEAIKDLVTDVNLDVSASGKLIAPSFFMHFQIFSRIGSLLSDQIFWTWFDPPFYLKFSRNFDFKRILLGISLQAMDTSHVALVSLNLSMEGFEHYRCD